VQLRKRKAVWVVGSFPDVVGYVIAPLAISRSGRRHGWRRGRPGPANMLGLVPLAAGGALVTWAITSHWETAPAVGRVTVLPDYLVRRGAYRVTRNPMYVGGATMQLGWAILLGSVPVLMALTAFVAGIDRLGMPFEERMLHDRFGASYDEYRDEVPRWLKVW
jgi:protein-S-isoprenylcysteine O-methyltransferase Ste14